MRSTTTPQFWKLFAQLPAEVRRQAYFEALDRIRHESKPTPPIDLGDR